MVDIGLDDSLMGDTDNLGEEAAIVMKISTRTLYMDRRALLVMSPAKFDGYPPSHGGRTCQTGQGLG